MIKKRGGKTCYTNSTRTLWGVVGVDSLLKKSATERGEGERKKKSFLRAGENYEAERELGGKVCLACEFKKGKGDIADDGRGECCQAF